jgi:ligand-binding sensor domain-containing protein
MSPLRAALPLLAAIAAWSSAAREGGHPRTAAAAPVARAGIAAKARILASSLGVDKPPEPPQGNTFDVLTDVRDVRACLPLDGGAVLAGTGGGLLLVRADGTARAPWTALDGLPETRVHALLRDGERLWIGTEGGLAGVRLQGDALMVERSILGTPVRALALHEGAVFAATWGGGVARLDEAKGRLVKLRGAERRFSALAEHEGSLFAGSATGLHRMVGDTVVPVVGAPASVWALAAHGGRLWIGSLTGLVSMSGGAFRGESDADVRALAPSGGALLAGTFGRGALAIEPGGPSRAIDGLSATAFVQAVGVSGGLRCVGGPEGLSVQRGGETRWEAPRVPELGSNDVSALARDGERLWIGTFDRGLAVLDGDRVTRVRNPALDDKINALAVERAATGSRLWVATARRLDRIEPRGGELSATRFVEIDGLPSRDVHAVAALASGGVLVGTGRGAAIVREGRVTALGEKRGIPLGAVWAVAEGPAGVLLLGTSRGLLVGDAESREVRDRGAPAGDPAGSPARPWVELSMATGDLEDDWITALAVHGRTVYVGTYNAGVTVVTLDGKGAFATEQLGGGYVNMGGLWVEGGTLFAATMNGLLMRPATGPGVWRHAVGAAPGRDVTAITPAPGGRLWVASRRGLARFDPK